MSAPLTLVFAAIGVVLAVRDPRRLLPGVVLTLAASTVVASLVQLVLQLTAVIAGLDEQARAVAGGLLLLAVPLVAGLVLGGTLVVNGLTMLRKERAMLANALSLLLGVAVLGLLVLGVAALVLGWLHLAVLLLLVLGPIAYLGVGFVAYLAWSFVYARLARRAPMPAAIIVLGSGLVDGMVPPLLAQRVAFGVAIQQAHPRSTLVLSGGQGADEPRPEAEAMAEHAVGLGAPTATMLEERASTTTHENLTLSRALLAERGIDGPVLAVTSDYHAFRAATLLRRLGIAGHAVGSRTARYYLPSALLREYIAILRDHLLGNAIALGVLLLPIVVFAVVALPTLVAG